jgi:MFS family permease
VVVKQPRRLGLLRRSPAFGLLFLATAGSSFGTYLAAVALTVDIKEKTEAGGNAGLWVAALLIADFLPIVLIGLLLGPLVDRLSRRRLMIVSDVARFGVFAVLPFVDSPAGIVALAGVAGVATGFFRPAAFAGLPNLVPSEELTNANSLLQTVETLAWMIGPVVAGVMLAFWSPAVPYEVNAVTFLVSAFLVARIPEAKMRSEQSLTRGHWRDVADGVKLVLTSAPLRTVLVAWNVVLLASAAINVAEIFFAQDTLDAGNVGFGIIVAASGVGLALGSYLAAASLGKVGLRRHYAGSIALMGVGWGFAALASSIWVAVPFIVAGAAGNGTAIVCNQILVQRGAPDRYRGRALATIMSSNYAVLGLAMAGAGVLTDAFGARWVWIGAGVTYFVAALVALVMTSWLPAAAEEQDEALEAAGEAAASTIGVHEDLLQPLLAEAVVAPAPEPVSAPEPEPEPVLAADPEPEPQAEPVTADEPTTAAEPVTASAAELVPMSVPTQAPELAQVSDPALVLEEDGREAATTGLERLAQLLEKIEQRREVEARRSRD